MPNEIGRFAGKVAFVTGAANGIGRAAALAFAREGASVVAADISERGNQETARMIEEAGGRALAVKCNVSRDNDVKTALEKTVETFGRLDFAFNNAGVEQPATPAADLTEQEWARIVDINLRGVFLCMKHEIPLMLKQGGGAIVNTSSGAGVAPERPLAVSAFSLLMGRRSLSGSPIGGIAETQEMLDFCGKHNITADVEVIPIQKVNEAYERLLKSDVKYRFSIDMASFNSA
jgi:NAD(P)-dependent dehydrogenase (short-subunit alcohol dehydrogenase family)